MGTRRIHGGIRRPDIDALAGGPDIPDQSRTSGQPALGALGYIFLALAGTRDLGHQIRRQRIIAALWPPVQWEYVQRS
jgi:hypothetical protein